MNNHPSRSIFHPFTLLALLLALLGSAVLATSAHAVPSTWTVQSPGDDGTAVPANCPGVNCRLRDAIAAAPSGATIDFSSDFTITLVSQIYFEKSLTITAVGRNVNISGGGTTRIFEISGDGITVVFNHLTLMNGNGVDRGAAIYLHYRYGYNNLTIIDSVFHDNHCGDYGGGAINVAYDTLKVYNSTFYNNSADVSAGAIDNLHGHSIIENSTFYNNHTPLYSGAIEQAGGSIVLTNNTFVGNSAPNGANVDFIVDWGTTVTANNNIFANGTSGASCACDNGWAACSIGGSGNFATDGSCGAGATVMTPSQAVFGPLENYGGFTQTIPLLPGNPAIGGGAAATCAGLHFGDYDQRGAARFGTCDAGSFESQGFVLAKTGGDNQSTVSGTPFGLPLTLSVTANNIIEPVEGGKVVFTAPAAGSSTSPDTNTATIASGGGVSQDLTANGTPGPYTVTASANGESVDFSLRNTTLPVITWANPANIVYGTALSSTQLNATADVPGTFTYNPALNAILTAGPHTLHVDFVPDDTLNYANASKDVSITVTQAAPVITWADPANIVYGTALSGTQLNASADVPGDFTYTPASGAVLNAGAQTLHVDFTPTDTVNYAPASKEVSITVTQATPVITWADPENIVYGTALGATQLNASADVPGTFTYTPAAGAILNVGPHTLHVDFTPTDTVNYVPASKEASITVTQATPVITWSDPASIDQGTPLGAAQLNATANTPGVFTYTPAAGIYLSTGTYTLHVDFVPTDTSNYINTSKDVSLTINDHVIFADVPDGYWARTFVERLYLNQVTGGCGSNPLVYCPTRNVNRAMMAVFVLRAAHGLDFTPPAATGTIFADVPADSFAAAWIEQLAAEGITGGCGGGNYCPNAPVTRAQMAVFLVKALYGTAYTPPGATGGIFADVPADGFAAAFIEQLAADGITGGCGGGNFCPNAYITRGEMAVFLVTAFNLP
ncbi:MAG: right-handed parallel beta-helix repeat-containing protein [Chloroflexi bacterium]|nr:right-handed parallel beta-helix repeat-containing protein [Chloroflexota bacterium]